MDTIQIAQICVFHVHLIVKLAYQIVVLNAIVNIMCMVEIVLNVVLTA